MLVIVLELSLTADWHTSLLSKYLCFLDWCIADETTYKLA